MKKPVQGSLRQAGKAVCGIKLLTRRPNEVGSIRKDCQEKPLLFLPYPYRKPTQVDEERILRPAGEVLLRNSAK